MPTFRRTGTLAALCLATCLGAPACVDNRSVTAKDAGPNPATVDGGTTPAKSEDAQDGGRDGGASGPTTCQGEIERGPTRLTGAAQAMREAISFITDSRDEPYLLLFADYFHRRFGVRELDGKLAEYDATLARGTDDDAYYRVLRRLADPESNHLPGDWDSVTSRTDLAVMPALYCNDRPLPADYAAYLAALRDEGGYSLTHVGMSLLLLDNNGCEEAVDEALRLDVEARIATLVNVDDGVADLDIEAMAFLLELGRADLVRERDLQAVVDARLGDGRGWLAEPTDDAGDWHATGLALWAILLHECPEAVAPLARQPSG